MNLVCFWNQVKTFCFGKIHPSVTMLLMSFFITYKYLLDLAFYCASGNWDSSSFCNGFHVLLHICALLMKPSFLVSFGFTFLLMSCYWCTSFCEAFFSFLYSFHVSLGFMLLSLWYWCTSSWFLDAKALLGSIGIQAAIVMFKQRAWSRRSPQPPFPFFSFSFFFSTVLMTDNLGGKR